MTISHCINSHKHTGYNNTNKKIQHQIKASKESINELDMRYLSFHKHTTTFEVRIKFCITLF